jgi:hypothetical protein
MQTFFFFLPCVILRDFLFHAPDKCSLTVGHCSHHAQKKNHTMGPRVVGPTITCGTLTNFVGVASDNDPQPAHRCAFA